jgi:hypothetical protein
MCRLCSLTVADRHKVRAIPFRPESEEDRAWLALEAADAGTSINAVLCRLVRDAREASERQEITR